MRPTGGPDPAPADGEPSLRRSRAYIARFVARVPLRAIRMKCGACMGGEADRMPCDEVAQAIEEFAPKVQYTASDYRHRFGIRHSCQSPNRRYP
jgi:hypothetical protein